MMCLGIDTQQDGGEASRETPVGAIDVVRHFTDAVNLCLRVGLNCCLDLTVVQERAACRGIIGASRAKLALGQSVRCLVHVFYVWWANRFVISIQPYGIGKLPVFAPSQTQA